MPPFDAGRQRRPLFLPFNELVEVAAFARSRFFLMAVDGLRAAVLARAYIVRIALGGLARFRPLPDALVGTRH